ncbi:hypothetical protein SARC_04202 [Sphaeroforma arctica JP610]|uniref:Uncharacterized protein n=1 Tax=Sphaeroforma arctica JP610 TaxID=667725 RepID=A0A0L0G3A2_9EUKA|nr:hypothetical protein SARC_04202 [Sphaeroforma arctica JP610]KNC83555.1 hypothetical protein SARC_04202 [Sphaeroforma arctica JP610]|eukprot:XP_014157457.1 hypothetical protein SARC_04202 [Sphaeroforma arctica JP610]
MKFCTIITIAAVAVAVSAKSYDQQITCAAKGFTGKSYDEPKVCCEYSGNCGNLSKCTESFCAASGRSGRHGRGSSISSGSSDNAGVSGDSMSGVSGDSSSGMSGDSMSSMSGDSEMSGKYDRSGKTDMSGNADKSDMPVSSDNIDNSAMPAIPGRAASSGSSGSPSYDCKITCAEKRVRVPDDLQGPIHEDKECCEWSGECGDLNKCTQSYCEKDSAPSDIYDFQF